jgi:hypothetical protein
LRQEVFFVNISEPAQIVVINARDPTTIAHIYEVPAADPHGPDLDTAHGRLFCAYDAKTLMCLEVHWGRVLDERELSGAPDVIFLNAQREHLYVAIGEPGVIDVFETITLQRIETVETERGAHTIANEGERRMRWLRDFRVLGIVLAFLILASYFIILAWVFPLLWPYRDHPLVRVLLAFLSGGHLEELFQDPGGLL